MLCIKLYCILMNKTFKLHSVVHLWQQIKLTSLPPVMKCTLHTQWKECCVTVTQLQCKFSVSNFWTELRNIYNSLFTRCQTVRHVDIWRRSLPVPTLTYSTLYFIYYIQGPPKKYIHTLTKKTLCCMLVLNLIIHHKLNTSYKFPVPVQLMEVLKLFAVSSWTPTTTASSWLSNLGQSVYGDCCTCRSNFCTKVPQR
jgi:hypothetical protein